MQQTAEDATRELEGLAKDQSRAVTVRRLTAPRSELLFRPEEVEAGSEVARAPIAAPPAPLDPREAPRRGVTRAVDGIHVELERGAALTAE